MSAEDYNALKVPLFAPDGFPERWGLNGLDPATENFTNALKSIQGALGIKQDGFCGPTTIDTMAAFEHGNVCREINKPGRILVGPKCYRLDFPTLTHLDDFTIGDTANRVRRDIVSQIVIHYDVAFNARSTEEILQKRGYSTHFIIDGDEEATIYQCHNPATRVAFHAGYVNDLSVGIDLNNPADVKYKKADEKRRGRERGVQTETIHGSSVNRLDYFPKQIDALNALLDVLCSAWGVPRVCPRNEDGEPIKKKIRSPKSFNGVVGHYHLSKRKTDPSPLDWNQVTPLQES